MKRREFLQQMGTGVTAAALSGRAWAESSDTVNLMERRPNIVFIMADDLGYGDLGCYGQQVVRTPNIDRLANQGLRFTQAYAGGPVCTPSRCSLMTGLHNGHTVARDNIPHYDTYLREEDVTVAEVLQQAGYRCGGVGKWSLGDAGTEGRATNQGFDTWFGYLNQDHAHYYYPDYLDDDEGRLEIPGNYEKKAQYSHDLMAERALQFVRDSKEGPFFLYAAFTLPHFASTDEDPDGLSVPSTEPYTEAKLDERTKKYAAMIQRLDRDVGRLLDLLDELGLADNTLVIFTSDNGGHHEMGSGVDTSGPLRGFKRDVTEGGIRVPFIARWPGVVPAGETSEEVIAFWDMLPTFAALAGAEAPAGIDGISVLDALQGRAIEEPHEYFYWDYGHCRERYDQAVRMGKWKGIRLGQGTPIQLYNLEVDAGEENDVSGTHPEVVQRMEQIMSEAVVPNSRYSVGTLYKGKAIWQKTAR